jgi:hypothetical protein
MAKRTDTVPKDLVNHLCKTIPGFKRESIPHQCELARMVWHGSSKRRRHHHFEGAMSFGYEELAEAFGRNVGGKGFDSVNSRLGFFEVTPNWSMSDGYTRGYKFSELVTKSRNAYLDKMFHKETKLLMMSGIAMKTLPPVVASVDMRGNASRWKAVEMANRSPVQTDALRELRKWLRGIRNEWREGRAPHGDMFRPITSLEFIERLHDMTSEILRLSKTDVAGNGYIATQYVQAQSGRLYAKGINLQTAPTLIKQAALEGLWEYDFSNCHFAILKQMAAMHGYQCNAIANYLNDKQSTRRAIAEQTEITETQAKVCLLAIMYGAKASDWHENAIPEEIGPEAAQRLFTVPLFAGIHADIKKARAIIIKGWKRTANGSLSNAFGKAIAGDAKPEEQLAHLIQGVEALALQTAIKMHPVDIVLLQHDGFASTRRLSGKAIMDAVFQATGYRLELEEKVIRIDPDAQFIRNRNKLEISPKPNIHAGLRHPPAS